MKVIRVADDVHQMMKSFAEAQERTITGYVNKHFRDTFGAEAGIAPPLAKNEVVLEDGAKAIVIPKISGALPTASSTNTHHTTMEDKLSRMQRSAAMNFCKEGHAIPAGRSKCLGKGCKYA